ncbi:MAG: hypothetical protein ACFBRM_09070 [Pikeienuella sp.]
MRFGRGRAAPILMAAARRGALELEHAMLRVGIGTSFRALRKEPLGTLVGRVIEAFGAAGLGAPKVAFSCSDSPISGGVAAVARAIKKHPELARFAMEAEPTPGTVDDGYRAQVLTNMEGPGEGAPVAIDTLLALAAGVPRSLPFSGVAIQLSAPGFGEGEVLLPGIALAPGVQIGDSWWVSGRQRSLAALYILEVAPEAEALPEPPAGIAAVLAACGKIAETSQVVIGGPTAPDLTAQQMHWREVLPALAADQPHDLPDLETARAQTPLGTTPGPMKPALTKAFKTLGYGCKGGSGIFTLTRRSAANTRLTLTLDVGTWSKQVSARFEAQALSGSLRLALPVAPKAAGALQYPIGSSERWAMIAANLAHLVAAIERELLPGFEAAAGPTPAWFEP